MATSLWTWQAMNSKEDRRQYQLDAARADPDNPPKLDGVLDAETGKPLVWRGGPVESP